MPGCNETSLPWDSKLRMEGKREPMADEVRVAHLEKLREMERLREEERMREMERLREKERMRELDRLTDIERHQVRLREMERLRETERRKERELEVEQSMQMEMLKQRMKQNEGMRKDLEKEWFEKQRTQEKRLKERMRTLETGKENNSMDTDDTQQHQRRHQQLEKRLRDLEAKFTKERDASQKEYEAELRELERKCQQDLGAKVLEVERKLEQEREEAQRREEEIERKLEQEREEAQRREEELPRDIVDRHDQKTPNMEALGHTTETNMMGNDRHEGGHLDMERELAHDQKTPNMEALGHTTEKNMGHYRHEGGHLDMERELEQAVVVCMQVMGSEPERETVAPLEEQVVLKLRGEQEEEKEKEWMSMEKEGEMKMAEDKIMSLVEIHSCKPQLVETEAYTAEKAQRSFEVELKLNQAGEKETEDAAPKAQQQLTRPTTEVVADWLVDLRKKREKNEIKTTLPHPQPEEEQPFLFLDTWTKDINQQVEQMESDKSTGLRRRGRPCAVGQTDTDENTLKEVNKEERKKAKNHGSEGGKDWPEEIKAKVVKGRRASVQEGQKIVEEVHSTQRVGRRGRHGNARHLDTQKDQKSNNNNNNNNSAHFTVKEEEEEECEQRREKALQTPEKHIRQQPENKAGGGKQRKREVQVEMEKEQELPQQRELERDDEIWRRKEKQEEESQTGKETTLEVQNQKEVGKQRPLEKDNQQVIYRQNNMANQDVRQPKTAGESPIQTSPVSSPVVRGKRPVRALYQPVVQATDHRQQAKPRWVNKSYVQNYTDHQTPPAPVETGTRSDPTTSQQRVSGDETLNGNNMVLVVPSSSERKQRKAKKEAAAQAAAPQVVELKEQLKPKRAKKNRSEEKQTKKAKDEQKMKMEMEMEMEEREKEPEVVGEQEMNEAVVVRKRRKKTKLKKDMIHVKEAWSGEMEEQKMDEKAQVCSEEQEHLIQGRGIPPSVAGMSDHKESLEEEKEESEEEKEEEEEEEEEKKKEDKKEKEEEEEEELDGNAPLCSSEEGSPPEESIPDATDHNAETETETVKVKTSVRKKVFSWVNNRVKNYLEKKIERRLRRGGGIR